MHYTLYKLNWKMVKIMKNLILTLMMTIGLVGCASADKLAMPKGKWQPINQAGFIPSTAQRYTEGVDVLTNKNVNEQNKQNVEGIEL